MDDQAHACGVDIADCCHVEDDSQAAAFDELVDRAAQLADAGHVEVTLHWHQGYVRIIWHSVIVPRHGQT